MSAFLLGLISIGGVTTFEMMKGTNFKNQFEIKKVKAEQTYFQKLTYGCECSYSVPANCEGTPISASCTGTSGFECVAPYGPWDCTMIFAPECNDMDQHECESPTT